MSATLAIQNGTASAPDKMAQRSHLLFIRRSFFEFGTDPAHSCFTRGTEFLAN
jgi:hypothetical protein